MPDYFCCQCNHIFSLPGENRSGNGICPACQIPGSARELFSPGGELGGCRIIQHLSSYGQISKYLAEQTAIKRQVVLKVLDCSTPDGTASLPAFLECARNSVKNPHSAIVSVINAGNRDHFHYSITPCIQGRTLAEILHDGKIYMPAEALSLLENIGEALQTMYQKQHVVHGQLTPESLILSSDGDMLLLDFWDSQERSSLSGRKDFGNILPFLAPEYVTENTVTPASDLYSLSAIFYYMTSGRKPFANSSPEEVKKELAAGKSYFQSADLTGIGAGKLKTNSLGSFLCFLEKLSFADPSLRPASWQEYLDEAQDLLEELQVFPHFHHSETKAVKAVVPIGLKIPESAVHEKKNTPLPHEEKIAQKMTSPAKEEKKEEKGKKKSFLKIPILLLELLLLLCGGYAAYYLIVYYPHLNEIESTRSTVADAEKAWEKKEYENFLSERKSAYETANRAKIVDLVKKDLEKLDKKYFLISPEEKEAENLKKQYYDLAKKFHSLSYRSKIYYSRNPARYTAFKNFDAKQFRQTLPALLKLLTDMEKTLFGIRKESKYLPNLLEKQRKSFTDFRKAFLTFAQNIPQERKIAANDGKKVERKESTLPPPAQAQTAKKVTVPPSPPQTSGAMRNKLSAGTLSEKQQTVQKFSRKIYPQLKNYSAYRQFLKFLRRNRIYYNYRYDGFIPSNYSYFSHARLKTHLPDMEKSLKDLETEIRQNISGKKSDTLNDDIKAFEYLKKSFADFLADVQSPYYSRSQILYRDITKYQNICGLYFVRYHNTYFVNNAFRTERCMKNEKNLKQALENLSKFFHTTPIKAGAAFTKYLEDQKDIHTKQYAACLKFFRKDASMPVLEKFATTYSNVFRLENQCRIYFRLMHNRSGKLYGNFIKRNSFTPEIFRQHKDRLQKTLEELLHICSGKYEGSKEIQILFNNNKKRYSMQLASFKKFCEEFEKEYKNTIEKEERKEREENEVVSSPSSSENDAEKSKTEDQQTLLKNYMENCRSFLDQSYGFFINYPLAFYFQGRPRQFPAYNLQKLSRVPENLKKEERAENIRTTTIARLKRLSVLHNEAASFIKQFTSSRFLCRNCQIFLRGNMHKVASIDGTWVFLQNGNKLHILTLGRYNLSTLAVYAAGKNRSMQKYLFAFLLKIFDFDRAGKEADNPLDRSIVKGMQGRFPEKVNTPANLFLVKNDYRNLPMSQQTFSLKQEQQEVEKRETEIRSNYNRNRRTKLPVRNRQIR